MAGGWVGDMSTGIGKDMDMGMSIGAHGGDGGVVTTKATHCHHQSPTTATIIGPSPPVHPGAHTTNQINNSRSDDARWKTDNDTKDGASAAPSGPRSR